MCFLDFIYTCHLSPVTQRSYEIINESYFVSATTIGENTTNISKLLFFTINLHFVTSNQVSTFRKLNLLLSSSIYFVFLPLEMQKRLKQSKVCHAFSYFVRKEATHKPLKVAAANSLFSSVFVTGTICFDECFSFYVITKRHYFSWKFIATLIIS